MNVLVAIPDAVADRLASAGGDLARQALEALDREVQTLARLGF